MKGKYGRPTSYMYVLFKHQYTICDTVHLHVGLSIGQHAGQLIAVSI